MEVFLIQFLQSNKCKFLDGVFWLFSFFASYLSLIILLLILCVYKRKKLIKIFMFSGGVNLLVLFTLKRLINRPRPYLKYASIFAYTNSISTSMPSVHSCICAVVSFYIFLVFFGRLKSKFSKAIFILFLIVFMLGVFASRMYFGMHYLSDLIVGYFIGIFVCCVIYLIFKKIKV